MLRANEMINKNFFPTTNAIADKYTQLRVLGLRRRIFCIALWICLKCEESRFQTGNFFKQKFLYLYDRIEIFRFQSTQKSITIQPARVIIVVISPPQINGILRCTLQ